MSTAIDTNKREVNNHNCIKQESFTTEKRILFFRIGVFFCLATAAALCGYFAYTLLYNQETNLFNQQYDSLVLELQVSERNFIKAQVQSMKLMAHMFQINCPDVTNWPNCSVPINSFDNMTYDLLPMTSFRSLTMAPLISASQAVSFESYALNFYTQQGYPKLGTNKASGIRGIYAKDANGKPYLDHVVVPGSKYPVLVPIFIIGQLKYNTAAALYNVYSEPIRAASINFVLDCSYASGGSCGAITDVIQLVQDGPTKRPAALLNYPVRALNQPEVIVGMMASVINWDTTLSNSLPSYVDGMVVVLDSGTQIYTYIISGGIATFQGIGDLHDSKYSSYGRTSAATPFAGAAVYTITTYPSELFASQYHTNIPVIACIIVVLILVFTSIVFFTYDFFVKRQATEKEAIIATRRQFVNFISHEIRTPLNTISLGMKLLLSEMTDALATYHEKKSDAVKVEEKTIKFDEKSNEDIEVSTKNSSNLSGEEDMAKKLEDYLSVVKDVEDSSYMAITILNDILNYDKLMQGKLNLELESFNIWDLIRSSSRAFTIQARQKSVNYEFKFQIDTISILVEENEKMGISNTSSLDMTIECAVGVVPIDVSTKSLHNKHTEMTNLVVIGDKIKISQVLRNMISNALKFTPSGGDVIISAEWNKDDTQFKDLDINTHITEEGDEETGEKQQEFVLEEKSKNLLSTSKLSSKLLKMHTQAAQQSNTKKTEHVNDFKNVGSITIKVTDSGAGLSPENLSQLFQEGVQFNANKLQGGGGSGLGLWISKGIVDMHHGLLYATSPGVGLGCSFIVSTVFKITIK